MYSEEAKCVDCGKTFVKRSSAQVRCKDCQTKHRRELDRQRRVKETYAHKRYKGAVYINGHPQICTHTAKCFYGSKTHNDCSYCIETGKSRIHQGLFIVDGKCDAYQPRGKKRMRRTEPVSYKPTRHMQVWGEV